MWQRLARREEGSEVRMWFYMYQMTDVHTGSPGKSTPLSSYVWKALVEKAAGPLRWICRWDIKKDYNTLLLPPHMGLTGTIAWEYHLLTNWGLLLNSSSCSRSSHWKAITGKTCGHSRRRKFGYRSANCDGRCWIQWTDRQITVKFGSKSGFLHPLILETLKRGDYIKGSCNEAKCTRLSTKYNSTENESLLFSISKLTTFTVKFCSRFQ